MDVTKHLVLFIHRDDCCKHQFYLYRKISRQIRALLSISGHKMYLDLPHMLPHCGVHTSALETSTSQDANFWFNPGSSQLNIVGPILSFHIVSL